MAIKPILFNTEMVRAILDGRNTCTRRIIKAEKVDNVLNSPARKSNPDIPDAQFIKCLVDMKYEPGDILYVRETWYKSPSRYMYRANYSNTERFYTDGKEVSIKWHPSIHMPKEAARIWLKVTDVRVERLQEITNDGCVAEGIYPSNCRECNAAFGCDTCIDEGYSEIDEFTEVWNSTIKKSDLDRYGWDANPWVWVIKFERCEKPENL